MYCCCWGENDCTDFGLTVQDQCFPLLYKNDTIYEICFQNGNLVIVLRSGKTLIFEERESLAQQKQKCSSKAKLIGIKGESIHTAISGESHVLFLTRTGRVFEFMRFAKNAETFHPRLVPGLEGICIIQIACGKYHSLVLSQGGKLFSWGLNNFGQLGISKTKPLLSKPHNLASLDGIPLAQVAAGSAHSIAVSMSGTVFTWGRNNAGQLGLGSTEDKYIPNIVKSLEQKKTVFVSCGEEHTAILTKGGTVFTFGAGGCGQLGHNSRRNELKPRLVAELLGVQVSQIACGWNHTLAYVCTTGKLYTFGCGLQGQLGGGKKCNQIVPLSVELSLTKKNSERLVDRIPTLIKRIHAGGNQSIIVYSEDENCSISEDQFAYSTNKRIATLEDGAVQKWINGTDVKRIKRIKREISITFSSAACLNGSFLETSNGQHFKTSPVAPGVDMSAVNLFFGKARQRPYVVEKMKTSLMVMLESLTDSPICTEAFRVYLIVPELIRLLDEEYSISLLTDLLSKAILKLKKDKLKIFESLLTAFPTGFFKMFVNLYQRVSKQHFESTIQNCSENSVKQLKMTLHILQSLYQVNLDAGLKIQEHNFYVPEVTHAFTELRDKCLQLRSWEELKKPWLLLLSLRCFPCIFDMEGKFRMFMAGGYIALQGMIPGVDNKLPVRRQTILHDAFHFLRRRSSVNFKMPLEVYFSREQGIDQGGVAQEFFTLVTKELCDSEAKIFKYYEESGLIWFPEDGSSRDEFNLAGKICGLALYNFCVADFHFPLALYKKLLDVQPTLEDLHELSPTEGRCLQELLDEDYEEVIDEMMLDFTKLNARDGSVAELIPNGGTIPVKKYNRKQYVDAYVNYVFNDSMKKNFEDFAEGFKTGCNNVMWTVFVPAELMAVIHGNTKYDWEQLEKNVKYRGYNASDEVIKNFWTVFHELSDEMKKRFLAFLTGSDRIPATGMEKFIFTICKNGYSDPDLFYPSANTCARILYIPQYSNIESLRNKLHHAIQFFEEFGLA